MIGLLCDLNTAFAGRSFAQHLRSNAGQTGYSGTPVVRLSGASAGAGADGLVLLNHTGSTVRGFVIENFR